MIALRSASANATIFHGEKVSPRKVVERASVTIGLRLTSAVMTPVLLEPRIINPNAIAAEM